MNRSKLSGRARIRSQAGFTLIELLVGLVLLALTVALLPGTLRLGARVWETRSDLERAGDLALVLGLLEQRIAEASPLFERSASGSVRVSFAGDSQTLEFVSPAENGPAGAGVYRYRLGPQTGAASGRPSGGLALQMSLYSPSPEVATEPSLGDAGLGSSSLGEIRLLVGGQASARFRYFGSQPAGRPSQWHDGWQRPDALPALVELTIVTAPGTSGNARRLVIAPRLDPRQ